MAKKAVVFLGIFLLAFAFTHPGEAARRVRPEDLFGAILNEVLKDSQGSTPPQTQTGGNPGDVARTLRASDLIKVEVIREITPLRDQPSANGKIIIEGRIDGGDLGPTLLLVDPQPINNEGASWYRAKFFNYSQLQYWFNDVPYLYVNTRDVRQVPLDADDKDFLERFDKGRPPQIQIGDDLEKIRKATDRKFRSADTIIPLTLYSEPDLKSKTIQLPAGSAIIDTEEPYGRGYYYHLERHHTFDLHIDMQDRWWTAVIDTDSQKVVGWLNPEEYRDENYRVIIMTKPDHDLNWEELDKFYIY